MQVRAGARASALLLIGPRMAVASEAAARIAIGLAVSALEALSRSESSARRVRFPR